MEQETTLDFHAQMVKVAQLFGHVQNIGKPADQDPLRDIPTAARNVCEGRICANGMDQTQGIAAVPAHLQGACQVLDLYLNWTPNPKQMAPTDFGKLYKVNSYSPRYLEIRNPHKRDQFLDFDDASHSYLLLHGSLHDCGPGGPGGPGVRTFGASVTFVASRLARDFDAAEVLRRMRNGKAWPRLKYTINPAPVHVQSLRPGCFGLLVEDENGHASLQPEEVAALLHREGNLQSWHLALVQELHRRYNAALSGCQVYSYVREMTDEEILQLWEQKKTDAANRGTEAHYQIELWLNRDHCRVEEPEVQCALHFLSILAGLYPGIKAYRTEWRVFAEREDLTGSIDLALRLPQGTLALIDWKRTSKGKALLQSRFNRMSAPFDHLQDCKGAIYALQLNLYRWILESYYGERVSLMAIVSIHPEVEPFFTAVPDLQLEVAHLMAECRARHQRVLMAEMKAPSWLRCAQTGQLMTEPVQLGNRFFQKACAKRLIGSDLETVQVNTQLADAVQELLRAEPSVTAVETAALLSRRKPWEELMPEEGLPLNHMLC